MNNYVTFVGKELTESLRTKRLLVLGCVFLFFAFTSPLLTRYMGEFFALFMPEGDDVSQALAAALGATVWQDSYAQFYGNIGQVGALTVLLIFMSVILREKRSGTADLMFTKGLKPSTFVLAKFTVGGVITLAVTIVSVLVCYIYTLVLFENGGQIGNVLLGGLAFAAFLLMLLAIVILCSAIAKSTSTSAVLGLLAFLFIVFAGIIPRIGRFSPGSLMGNVPIELTLGQSPSEPAAPLITAAALTVVSLWAAARFARL